jgi:CRP/FNR family transcriptional regulator, cyclic AMP receptor protein
MTAPSHAETASNLGLNPGFSTRSYGSGLATMIVMQQCSREIRNSGGVTMQSLNAPVPYIDQPAGRVPTAPPFSNLRPEAQAQFNASAMEMSYPRGGRLFLEDEAPQHIFVLSSGRVKLSVTSREGKVVILRVAGAGDILGLGAALAAKAHEVSAEVLEPCRAKVLRTKDFLAFLQEYPEAATEATRCILNEYQATFSNMCRLALPTTVAGRLANLLLEWLNGRRERGAKECRLIVALTHEEIAGMTNTSRETVSRVFHQFQRDKLIAIKGASLTVLQPQALEQLAC